MTRATACFHGVKHLTWTGGRAEDVTWCSIEYEIGFGVSFFNEDNRDYPVLSLGEVEPGVSLEIIRPIKSNAGEIRYGKWLIQRPDYITPRQQWVGIHDDYDPTPEHSGDSPGDALHSTDYHATIAEVFEEIAELEREIKKLDEGTGMIGPCDRCGQRAELFDAEEYNGRLYYGLGAAPANRSDPADGVNVVEVCADCLNTEVTA